MQGGTPDDVIVALGALTDALRQNIAASRVALERAAAIVSSRREGAAYRSIVSGQPRPLVVELLTENLERLLGEGAGFRRALALALHEEGMTMDDIADLYGVTRQRISTLLREAGADAGVGG